VILDTTSHIDETYGIFSLIFASAAAFGVPGLFFVSPALAASTYSTTGFVKPAGFIDMD